MSEHQPSKSRPYLSQLGADGSIVFAKSAKEFKSDLEPHFDNMAELFANFKTHKLEHKLCSAKCLQNSKCTKQCIDEKNKRLEELILVDKNESRLKPVIQGIERGEDPDTVVIFENVEFACTGIVLGIYSNFFNERRGSPVIDLRNAPLDADTFEQIYKWMIKPDELLKLRDVVQLTRAAFYLEMRELIELCYTMLDSDVFRDFYAFDIMYKTRSYAELHAINMAMANRIYKSTLIILCSREFLHLNEEQVCTILQSSALAVNSETELLFGALHWLLEDWPTRKSCVINVLNNIRFAYLSPAILCQLNGPNMNQIGPFGRVLDEFAKMPEMNQLVEDGIFYSTLVITMGGDASQLKDIPGTQKELMMPRHWVQDSRCSYHRPVTKLCPNMRAVSYDEFVVYSETLQESGLDYERYIQYPVEEENSQPLKFNELSLTSRSGSYDQNWANSSGASKSSQSETSGYSECDTLCQLDIDTKAEDSTDQSLEQWRQQTKGFRPSHIWKEWERTVLRESNENEPTTEKK